MTAPVDKHAFLGALGRFASGVTVVMSTHNLGQAKRLATRVVYLQAGRLVVERPVGPFFDGAALPPEAARFLQGELGWR